jgi:adenylate kinase
VVKSGNPTRGKNFNIADINYPGDPPIVMPPLNPPAGCEGKMTQRADDTEEVVRARWGCTS